MVISANDIIDILSKICYFRHKYPITELKKIILFKDEQQLFTYLSALWIHIKGRVRTRTFSGSDLSCELARGTGTNTKPFFFSLYCFDMYSISGLDQPLLI